jgi:hypothetical protein
MVLLLSRTYFPDGTNGKLECEGKLICKTIELPWKKNETKVSCIPEGKYFIRKRYSNKFKWHMQIAGVENRSLILFHSANNAFLELNGCIAPVTKLSGPGLGLMSRKAFITLKELVYKNIINRVKAPTPKFFKVLRNIGLVLAAVGATILASPFALPVVIVSVGGYIAVAGGVISAVSQLTTIEGDKLQKQNASK